MAAELVTTLQDDADVLPRPYVGTTTDVLVQELLVGGQVEVNLPELGATGTATIIAVQPCPDIEPDDG